MSLRSPVPVSAGEARKGPELGNAGNLKPSGSRAHWNLKAKFPTLFPRDPRYGIGLPGPEVCSAGELKPTGSRAC
ncbi:hypothetical protein ACQP3J_27465 [Escherichia coli]